MRWPAPCSRRPRLPQALQRLGFVQADPLRAPARAQDLTLRHRVRDYRAGDLERRYPRLSVEEDFFVNYGFLPRDTHALMHPRLPRTAWPKARWAQAEAVLAFVRERGVVHPREVDAAFPARPHAQLVRRLVTRQHAAARCHALPRPAARGAARRRRTRCYAARDAARRRPPTRERALDALIDVVVGKYAPLPAPSLGYLVSLLRFGRAAMDRACGALR